jgi:hypothetical protein
MFSAFDWDYASILSLPNHVREAPIHERRENSPADR